MDRRSADVVFLILVAILSVILSCVCFYRMIKQHNIATEDL